MIVWGLHILRNGIEDYLDVTNNETVQINETDYVDIVLTLTDEHTEIGEPFLLIGDVPVELEILVSNESRRQFKTIEPVHKYEKQIFYNYFGESEVLLYFTNGKKNDIYSIKVDVKARQANAELASRMIDFLSSNTEDAMMLCFSKAHIGSGAQSLNENSLTKFQLLKNTICDLVSKQGVFLRDHKYIWENILKLSRQGQASGSDSIHYLLNHLDKVSPTSNDKSNIKINNRAYWLSEMPCEELNANTDVFENRVIYSFLFSAKKYLRKLKSDSEKQISSGVKESIQTGESNDFVTFDNVLFNYKISILRHHIEDVYSLNKQVDYLINAYNEKMKIKLVPLLRPRVTPFVAARPHYRAAFKNIHQWYLCDAPDLESNSFLLGLRNLSTIYELVCLILLHKVMMNKLGFKYIKSDYIKYDESLSFNGVKQIRPKDQSNNAYYYAKGNLTASIKYEPRIYQFREKISEVNDLINVSNRSANSFGLHYYKPDYVVTFKDEDWIEDLVVVLDAKYQSYDNIMKYSLAQTEQKYLRDVFALKEDMSIGLSPVKALMLLYAHGVNRVASKLHKRHYIGEKMEVLPQAFGFKVTPDPDSEERIFKYFASLITSHSNQSKKLVNNKGLNYSEFNFRNKLTTLNSRGS